MKHVVLSLPTAKACMNCRRRQTNLQNVIRSHFLFVLNPFKSIKFGGLSCRHCIARDILHYVLF